jgi:hypothetical protein
MEFLKGCVGYIGNSGGNKINKSNFHAACSLFAVLCSLNKKGLHTSENRLAEAHLQTLGGPEQINAVLPVFALIDYYSIQ